MRREPGHLPTTRRDRRHRWCSMEPSFLKCHQIWLWIITEPAVHIHSCQPLKYQPAANKWQSLLYMYVELHKMLSNDEQRHVELWRWPVLDTGCQKKINNSRTNHGKSLANQDYWSSTNTSRWPRYKHHLMAANMQPCVAVIQEEARSNGRRRRRWRLLVIQRGWEELGLVCHSGC